MKRPRPTTAHGIGWLVLMVIVGSLPAPTSAQTTSFDESGVHVIVRTTPGNRVVSVRLYLLGGSALLTRETAGIETLLLRTLELNDPTALRRTGSRPILEATRDWTVAGFVGLQADLNTTWHSWSERFTRPRLDQAALCHRPRTDRSSSW